MYSITIFINEKRLTNRIKVLSNKTFKEVISLTYFAVRLNLTQFYFAYKHLWN